MAYLEPIEFKCDDCNTRRARVQLVTHINDRRGRYCARCGTHRLTERLKFEQDMFAIEQSREADLRALRDAG